MTRTYNFTVTNTGGDNTGQTITTIQIIPGGNVIEISTGNLRGGESVSLSADLTFTEAGSFRVEVKADADGVVAELSEVNNTASLDVSVSKQP